jgi:hypothetical protein
VKGETSVASGRRGGREESMLGKRSRPVQKTPSKLHLMPDYPSDSSPTRDWPEDKHKFFNAPSIFTGFNPKGSSDSEGAKSPTSPLDIKTFSGVGIAHWPEKQIRSPRSGLDGSQCGSPRPWEKRDSEGIGLGILAALHSNSNNNCEANGGAISSSRGPLLGSQLKILVGSQLSSPQMKKQSETILIGSPVDLQNPPLRLEWSIQRSYTCVTSGPKSSTKHIYTHCGMESEMCNILFKTT